jgi:hypothetical protein
MALSADLDDGMRRAVGQYQESGTSDPVILVTAVRSDQRLPARTRPVLFTPLRIGVTSIVET